MQFSLERPAMFVDIYLFESFLLSLRSPLDTQIFRERKCEGKSVQSSPFSSPAFRCTIFREPYGFSRMKERVCKGAYSNLVNGKIQREMSAIFETEFYCFHC